MPFPKFDNDLLKVGNIEGEIPIIGPGDKLDTSLIDTGLTVGKIVQLDSSAKLPALDGSLLNNLPAAEGGWNLIDTQIANNSAQVDFTSGIDSTYKEYVIRGTEIVVSVPSRFAFRVSVAGVFRSGAEYTYAGDGTSNQQGSLSFNSASDNEYIIIPTNVMPQGVDGNVSFDLSVTNPAGTTSTKAIRSNAGGSNHNDNGGFSCQSGGRWFGASQTPPFDYSALDGFRILTKSGVLVRGTFKLYGIN